MAQQARYGGHVGPAGDQQTGVGVAQGVDIQGRGQTMLLQNQLDRQVKVEGVMGSRSPWRRKM